MHELLEWGLISSDDTVDCRSAVSAPERQAPGSRRCKPKTGLKPKRFETCLRAHVHIWLMEAVQALEVVEASENNVRTKLQVHI